MVKERIQDYDDVLINFIFTLALVFYFLSIPMVIFNAGWTLIYIGFGYLFLSLGIFLNYKLKGGKNNAKRKTKKEDRRKKG